MNPNMTRHPAVYGLVAGGSFGYVGSTRVNMKTRWWEHRSRARGGHTAPVYDWMREVGIERVEILELESGDDLEKLEVKWILKIKAEGHPITNQVSSDGRLNSNAERMKRRLSEQRKGKPTWIKGKTGEAAGWTPERRAAQSARMKGRQPGK